MTEASPRPWRTGTSPGVDGRTIYSPIPGYPRDKLIGTMDTAADAALTVAAVNGYGEPTSIEADLRTGWRESERRRHVAIAVAGHLRECLARHGSSAPVDEVLDAFTAVVAALRGTTDPVELGIAGAVEVVAQVEAIAGVGRWEAGRG